MTVLQLVTRRQFRGAEVFASILSEDLQQSGVRVLFVGIYPPPAQALTPPGAWIKDLTSNTYRARIVELRSILQEHKPDVIQANGSVTLQFALAAKLLSGSKAKLIYRNISMISGWMKNPLKRIIYRALFKKVDRVVSVSDESRLDFIKAMNYPAQKIFTMRRGVEVLDEWPPKTETSSAYLLHVGSFTAEKNHQALIRIFEMVSREFPEVQLICLGEGPLKPEIETLIQSKSLQEKVLLKGFVANTAQYYREATVLLMTSTIEGVPGVVMEAGAQGTPAVAFHVGGMAEVIKHEKTGFLISPGNEIGFASSVVALLKDAQRQRELGRNAFEHVRENYNRKKTSHRFLDLYRSLVNSN